MVCDLIILFEITNVVIYDVQKIMIQNKAGCANFNNGSLHIVINFFQYYCISLLCMPFLFKWLYSNAKIDGEETATVFTEVSSTGEVRLKSKRSVLLVSSTSWTEDEDFSILLMALEGRLLKYLFRQRNFMC